MEQQFRAPRFEPNRDVPSVFQLQHDRIHDYLQKYKTYQTDTLGSGNDLLHFHQVDAVLELSKYFSSNPAADRANPDDSPPGKIALVVLPTGCGKTGVAVLACFELNAKHVLVITPSMIISKQLDKAYEQFLLERKIVDVNDQWLCTPKKMVIKKSEQLVPQENVILRHNLIITNAHKISDRSKVKVDEIDPTKHIDLVIVDEAHHYPARTWKQLVDHFPDCKKIFLTATPFYKGDYILKDPLIKPCYELSRDKAVSDGIIRKVEFTELDGGNNKEEQFKMIADAMEKCLDNHDELDDRVKHQGMVIAQTKDDDHHDSARMFCDVYNQHFPDQCKVYDGDSPRAVLDEFKGGKFRTLVIIRKLLEGFDHKPVSVLGIARNIALQSRVLFTQFVGRAVRKTSINDPVEAQIVTHEAYKQKQNYDMLDKVTDADPEDPNDDLEE